MAVNIPSQIVVQTAAQWAADATIYSAKRILVTSDVLYTGIDQRKFKLANGIDVWSALDYVPIGELLNGITIDWSRDSGVYAQAWFYAHTTTYQCGYGNQYLAFTNAGIKPFGVSGGVSKLVRYNASGILVPSTYDESDIVLTNDSRLTDARHMKIDAYDNTDSTTTGGTSEVYMKGLSVPQLTANSKLEIVAQFGKTGGAGIVTWKVYHNATNNLSGSPVLIATGLHTAGQEYVPFERKIINKNSLTLNSIFRSSVTAVSDTSAGNASNMTVLNTDLSGRFIVISATPGSAADTVILHNYQLMHSKP